MVQRTTSPLAAVVAAALVAMLLVGLVVVGPAAGTTMGASDVGEQPVEPDAPAPSEVDVSTTVVDDATDEATTTTTPTTTATPIIEQAPAVVPEADGDAPASTSTTTTTSTPTTTIAVDDGADTAVTFVTLGQPGAAVSAADPSDIEVGTTVDSELRRLLMRFG